MNWRQHVHKLLKRAAEPAGEQWQCFDGTREIVTGESGGKLLGAGFTTSERSEALIAFLTS